MSDFIWIIPSERQSSLGNGGISPNYIIPQGQMNGQEQRLRGSRLWIVLRGGEDRCIAVASIKRVERFHEGYYAGDFLISCDMTTSFRLSSSFEGAKLYTLSDFRDLDLGIHRALRGSADKLRELVLKTVQIKLATPTDASLKRIKFDVLPKNSKGLAKAAISLITQELPLDQIWASGTGEKLGPIANFACRLLALHNYDISQVVAFLKVSDPITLLVEIVFSAGDSKLQGSAQNIDKSVDLDFTEINPQMIYAREFMLSEGYLPDLESALSKTENAEKIHQEMLRDISSYLKSKGVVPYESNSIDLMISHNGIIGIYEIKSCINSNIIAQAAKGAFQIACYLDAMRADYYPLNSALILYKLDDENLENFVHRALAQLGINVLTYDPNRDWPDRVTNLLGQEDKND